MSSPPLLTKLKQFSLSPQHYPVLCEPRVLFKTLQEYFKHYDCLVKEESWKLTVFCTFHFHRLHIDFHVWKHPDGGTLLECMKMFGNSLQYFHVVKTLVHTLSGKGYVNAPYIPFDFKTPSVPAPEKFKAMQNRPIDIFVSQLEHFDSPDVAAFLATVSPELVSLLDDDHFSILLSCTQRGHPTVAYATTVTLVNVLPLLDDARRDLVLEHFLQILDRVRSVNVGQPKTYYFQLDLWRTCVKGLEQLSYEFDDEFRRVLQTIL